LASEAQAVCLLVAFARNGFWVRSNIAIGTGYLNEQETKMPRHKDWPESQ